MSSVRFTLPSWPPVTEDDVFYQEIIVWIYCALFMLILPLIMTYYYYALYKLRFLMALRRRHFKLLTFLFVIILIDFIVIEPIRLLCGTYLPHIQLLYWIYFILSTFSTQIIVYTLLLKIWLLFYDIKWSKVCIINDNQWRYHINNPLDEQQQKPQPQNMNQNGSKNGKMKHNKNKPHQYEEEDEEKGNINIEHFDNNTIHNSDMSWFVRRRQSFGNIQYIYKYFGFIVVLSVVISLVSKCLFTSFIHEVIINVLILIPIIIIYILWLNTPQFNDPFSLRKEMKYLLIYGLFCVIINTIIDALLYTNENNLQYWIEMELVLIFIYHIVIFGIFMFLVSYPIGTMIKLYGNRMYGSLNEENNRTHSITINEQRVAHYCCLCFISLQYINKVAIFDNKLTGVNHTILSGKESMNLQMVASSSNNPNKNRNNLDRQIEMTQKHKNKNKKIKTDKYKFDNIAGIDDESIELFNVDEKEKETDSEYANVKGEGEQKNEVSFVAIKPAMPANNSVNTTNTKTDSILNVLHDTFKLFESDDGLQLFMHHCCLEFSLENIFAIIELNQYQIYCKKQEKYILKQKELRKKTAKQRFKKKKESIRRVKAHKNEEIKNKKEKLKLKRESITVGAGKGKGNQNINHSNNLKHNMKNNLMSQSLRKKRHSVKKRRRQRIKQNNLEQDMIDDDDLILDEIASKPPINTHVSNILNYNFDSFAASDTGNEMNEHKIDKTMDASLSDGFAYDGNEGDDEEEDDSDIFDRRELNELFLNINDKINNLPESSIINKPFIVNSKNKRLKQLELICIELCKKYILSKSQFQLNLAKHIIIDIENKILQMKQNHINFKNNINLKAKTHKTHSTHMHVRNNSEFNNGEYNYNSSDDETDALPPIQKLQFTASESNYSIHYENQLHVFFDHIIEQILNLINDSFYRLKQTKQYHDFINK